MPDSCPHIARIRDVTPSAAGCEECLKIGDTWVHLRLCLTCGHVGCCDNSKNRHATRHYHETRHPVIQSLEPGEDWGWCYVDNVFFDSMPRPRRPARWFLRAPPPSRRMITVYERGTEHGAAATIQTREEGAHEGTA